MIKRRVLLALSAAVATTLGTSQAALANSSFNANEHASHTGKCAATTHAAPAGQSHLPFFFGKKEHC
jgi:hypothetical protein